MARLPPPPLRIIHIIDPKSVLLFGNGKVPIGVPGDSGLLFSHIARGIGYLRRPTQIGVVDISGYRAAPVS